MLLNKCPLKWFDSAAKLTYLAHHDENKNQTGLLAQMMHIIIQTKQKSANLI